MVISIPVIMIPIDDDILHTRTRLHTHRSSICEAARISPSSNTRAGMICPYSCTAFIDVYNGGMASLPFFYLNYLYHMVALLVLRYDTNDLAFLHS
jgi:hypothetical protein